MSEDSNRVANDRPRVALPDAPPKPVRVRPGGHKKRGPKVSAKRAKEIAAEKHNPIIPGQLRTRDRLMYEMGRPPRLFEPELAEILVQRVALADNLLEICREEGIGWWTVCKWRETNPDFAARWNAARLLSAEMFEAKAQEAAYTATADNHQGHRLRMLVCEWTATKRNAKVYNDKTLVIGDAENPVVVSHVHSLRQELIRRLDAMAIPEPLIIEHKPE